MAFITLRKRPIFFHERLPIYRATRQVFLERETSHPAFGVSFIGKPPRSGREAMILTCCDEIYFYRFARNLAASVQQNSPNTRLHIHIYAPSAYCIGDAANFLRTQCDSVTISHEDGSRCPHRFPDRFFFAAGRFAVADYFLKLTSSPVLIIDTDGAVRQELSKKLEDLGCYDAALVLRTERHEPKKRVLGGAVFVNATSLGRRFAARLACSIHKALDRKLPFHVDQLVLYYLYCIYKKNHRMTQIGRLGREWIDFEFEESSYIWTAKGQRKELLAAKLKCHGDRQPAPAE